MTASDLCRDPLLKLTLHFGSVYYFQDRHFSSGEPHYFIVINSDPVNDAALLLVVASTQLQKVRERCCNLPADTLIDVALCEYKEFPDPSIIDCNNIVERPHSRLIEKRREGKLGCYLDDFPQVLMKKIIAGVRKSPIHKPSLTARIPQIL